MPERDGFSPFRLTLVTSYRVLMLVLTDLRWKRAALPRCWRLTMACKRHRLPGGEGYERQMVGWDRGSIMHEGADASEMRTHREAVRQDKGCTAGRSHFPAAGHLSTATNDCERLNRPMGCPAATSGAMVWRVYSRDWHVSAHHEADMRAWCFWCATGKGVRGLLCILCLAQWQKLHKVCHI